MNRLLLLLTAILLADIPVGAQGLLFMYKNQALEDGATVSIAAEEDFFGEMSCETNPSTAPSEGLVLNCPATFGGNVSAELQILSNTLDASAVQWCMGGECSLVGNKTQMSKTFSPGTNIQVLLDATNIKNDGMLMAKLSVQFNNTTRTVYIQFTNGDATAIHYPQSIIHNSQCYDLGGRKVQKPRKGICILNGKKYMK